MQDQPRLSTPGIGAADRRFVTQRYGSRATGMRALGAGEWSRAYAMVLDGRPVVIRFGDHVEDFRKDQMMAGYSRGGLPIPAVADIGATDDGYFAVSEQAAGELLDGLDEDGMRAALPGLLAALDAIRQIDVTGTRGYGIWAPDRTGPAASWAQALMAINQETTRVPGWRAALRDFPPSAHCFGRAYALLGELVAGLPETRHIIHGDLLNRNVLVRGSRITAVIDWGNAWYGDWLYDAAWLIYWWPWFPRWQAIDIGAELATHWEHHGGLPADLDHRLQAYLLHIGLDALAYNAFRGRRDDLTRVTAQVARLINE